MIEVDRAMIEDYGISLVQMMENAGRNLAELGRARFLAGDARGKRVVVLTGGGNNGGGGLVAARRLAGWGAEVEVLSCGYADRCTEANLAQLRSVQAMGLPIRDPEQVAERLAELGGQPLPALVIDAVIGYGLRQRAPHGAAAALINYARAATCPVLALDAPSGVDVETGEPLEPAVVADASMTLALPKPGLFAPAAKNYVGEIYLADISVPPKLYARPALGLRPVAPFYESELVRLS
jgi:NAD(P)H-hydrate epimerase